MFFEDHYVGATFDDRTVPGHTRTRHTLANFSNDTSNGCSNSPGNIIRTGP